MDKIWHSIGEDVGNNKLILVLDENNRGVTTTREQLVRGYGEWGKGFCKWVYIDELLKATEENNKFTHIMTVKEFEERALELYPRHDCGFFVKENQFKREGYIQGMRDMQDILTKNVTIAEVIDTYDKDICQHSLEFLCVVPAGLKDGDKVKLVVIKE